MGTGLGGLADQEWGFGPPSGRYGDPIDRIEKISRDLEPDFPLEDILADMMKDAYPDMVMPDRAEYEAERAERVAKFKSKCKRTCKRKKGNSP